MRSAPCIIGAGGFNDGVGPCRRIGSPARQDRSQHYRIRVALLSRILPIEAGSRRVPTWSFDCIDIEGGFLSGLSIRFLPGLICVLGPRESGKSTLVEALRYGVGGIAKASKQRVDMIQANLGASIVTVRTKSDERVGSYTIRRSHRQS